MESSFSVIVVTFNSAAQIPATLAAVQAQLATGDELIVVDNGSTDGTAAAVRAAAPQALLVEQENAGFAAGCAAGATPAGGELLLFLNPDALLEPGALAALRAQAVAEPAWGAWQPVVTLADGAHINTAGGVVHLTGIAWAGRCDEPVDALPAQPYRAPFASGAALVVRRDVWQQLGGMPERYFMYVEDVDLSLRLWQAGSAVGVVPAARVRHDYEFAKGAYKWRMLERNRWATLLTVFPGRLLLVLAPVLAAGELAVFLTAVRGGWAGQKVRAAIDVLRWLPWVWRRRRVVRGANTISTAEFATLLQADLDSPYTRLPRGLGRVVNAGLRVYWRLCTLLLGRAARNLLD